MKEMKITIKQSGQGLLSVDINNQPSTWKIAKNSKGIWNLYRTVGYSKDEPNYLKIKENLAGIIHKDELNSRVGALIGDWYHQYEMTWDSYGKLDGNFMSCSEEANIVGGVFRDDS